jgi:hypothetical protein
MDPDIYELAEAMNVTDLNLTLSTTRRTSARHHLPLGFLTVHWQFPNFFSIWIFSMIVERPFFW